VYSQLLLGLGAPDCPVVHRTVSGAPDKSKVNWPLSGLDGGVRLQFTRLSGGAPDCPVSRPWRSRHSREKFNGVRLKFTGLSGGGTGLSGEPTVDWATVGRAIRGRRVARSNGRQEAPNCPVCTGQCPVCQLP
jgi:hypothetical protein